MGQVLSTRLPAVGANGTTTQELGAFPTMENEGQIGRVELVPSASRAADTAPNFATINVRQLRAGTPTVVASLPLTVALVAETPIGIPFVGGFAAEQTIGRSEDVLDVTVTQAGTGGAALADGNEVQVEIN